MLLWLTFAVLTAITLAVVLAPLRRHDAGVVLTGSAADMAVYRDQLREVDAEVEQGLISPGDAEAAKTEVSRRLLKHADNGRSNKAGKAGKAAGRSISASRAFFGVLLLVPAVALSAYLKVGSPNQPGHPHVARAKAPVIAAKSGNNQIEELIAQVESALRKNPLDGKGWDALAPVYLKLERPAKAAHAFSRAIDLLGETPQRLAGYAEAMVNASGGIVTKQAREAFMRLETLDPGRAVVRYWLAVAKEQGGDVKAAITDYRALLKDAKADVPWRHIVEKQLAQAGARLNGAKAAAQDGRPAPKRNGSAARSGNSIGAPVVGPTKQDVEDSAQMSRQDRGQMIEGMVARFERKLKAKPDDLAGWKKLMKFYVVLERRQEAVKALAQARKQFSGNSKALSELDDVAKLYRLGP